MTVPHTVYEGPALAAASGGTAALRLLVANSSGNAEIRIECDAQLRHKTLKFVVLRIQHPTLGIEPLARAMTTITHELERLHRLG